MTDIAPLISIIVVSYNTREMTLACLRSVIAETSADFELIVVDNASDDGSAVSIAKEFPDISLLAETENHGFAAANNMAAQQARGEYLLLLNPDTVVLDKAVDRVVEFARAEPKALIWGGRTLFGDRSLNRTSCWRRMSLWNIFCRTSGLTGVFSGSEFFNSEAYGDWDRGNKRQVDIVTGCFLLIRHADWNALGGFDNDFVIYGEEVDLCLRAERNLGAAPQVTPEATIIHYGGASQKVRSDKLVRVLRAKTELIKRHIPGWQRPLALWLFRLWPLSRAFAFGLLARLGLREPGQGGEVWREVWQRRAEWRTGF